jgi:3-hydroxyisobutyrate dehydrogenase-like beta-hydroxyacid dehydrogenase
MRVGFVGAGAMGRPMVERLLHAGHDVSVYARRPEVTAALADIGATPASTPASVSEGTAVVMLCPFTDEQVRDIALADGVLAAMASPAVLVIHTTGSPQTAAALAGAAPPGVGVIDAPVSGGPASIAAGAITLFVGGSAGDVDRAQPVLAAYGNPILHVGPLGCGQLVKLINNALFAAHLQLAADTSRLAADAGISPELVARAVTHGSGASRAIEILAGRRDMDTLKPFVDKDVEVLHAVATELHLDLGLLAATNAAGPSPFGR